MKPKDEEAGALMSYTRNLQNLRCRRQLIRLPLTEGPSLSLPGCAVGHEFSFPTRLVRRLTGNKMVLFYLSISIKEILHKNLSEFTPGMSWLPKAEKQEH